MIFWAHPLFLAAVGAALVLCIWLAAEAATAGRPGRATAAVAAALLLSAPVWVNALLSGEGIPSYDRLAELRELEDEFGAYEVGASAGELPFGGPVLHRMELGDRGAVAAPPDCSEVVGLGLLGLSNQLGVAAQDIGIVGVSARGNAVAVPPDQARRLVWGGLDPSTGDRS